MRSCIEADRERDRSAVVTAWMAFNLDDKGIKKYIDPTGKNTRASKAESAGDWKRLAKSMRHLH